MAIDFPASPTVGQTYAFGGITYTFTSDGIWATGTMGPFQPLDADLTAIAALTGTNVMYYRSAADTWTAVSISTGLTFSSGALACSVVPATVAPLMDGIAAIGVSALYARQDHVHPTDTTKANLASPAFTGTPTAPTPATADSSTNVATTAFVKAQNYVQPTVTAMFTVGYTFAANNLGTISSGTTTPNPALGNYQYYTNNGAHTLAAPTADCAMDIMILNGASAGAITFTGFSVGSNVGDSLTTTSGNRFIVSIRRINAVATYTIKALQ